MPDLLRNFRQCSLFSHLTEEQLQRIQLSTRLDRFAKGSPIYSPVDPSNAVYLVCSGRVKICHLTQEGKQSTLAFLETGEIFGELSVLDSGPREEYAEAVRDASVIRMASDRFCSLMTEFPEVALQVTRLIASRRRHAERRLKNLLFLSNRDRLIHLLLELAEKYGQTTKDGLRLATDLSHQDLASMIGSTRETVTLVLGELQNEGLLQLGRRKVTLVQPDLITELVRRLPGAALVPAFDTAGASLAETHEMG